MFRYEIWKEYVEWSQLSYPVALVAANMISVPYSPWMKRNPRRINRMGGKLLAFNLWLLKVIVTRKNPKATTANQNLEAEGKVKATGERSKEAETTVKLGSWRRKQSYSTQKSENNRQLKL